MNPEEAYKVFTNLLTVKEQLEIKTGKGGLSYYKNGVFVCHFNAQPQKKRDDLGFADFRYDGLRPYLDIEKTLRTMEKDAMLEVQIKSHKLWCSLHFPLSQIHHVAELFLKHIISSVNPKGN
jgi:hypothetical protein